MSLLYPTLHKHTGSPEGEKKFPQGCKSPGKGLLEYYPKGFLRHPLLYTRILDILQLYCSAMFASHNPFDKDYKANHICLTLYYHQRG